MTTGLELILAGVLLMLPGYWSSVKRKKELRELRRYEFEHRTDGGVVQFKTFEDSEEHQRRRRRAPMSSGSGCLYGVGVFMIVIGIIWILFHL